MGVSNEQAGQLVEKHLPNDREERHYLCFLFFFQIHHQTVCQFILLITVGMSGERVVVVQSLDQSIPRKCL